MLTLLGKVPVLCRTSGRVSEWPNKFFLNNRRASPLLFLTSGLVILILGKFPSPANSNINWRPLICVCGMPSIVASKMAPKV